MYARKQHPQTIDYEILCLYIPRKSDGISLRVKKKKKTKTGSKNTREKITPRDTLRSRRNIINACKRNIRFRRVRDTNTRML